MFFLGRKNQRTFTRKAVLLAAAALLIGAGPPSGMPVPVTKPVKRSIPLTLAYSARIEAIRGITLQARVTGYVVAQPASDGADVQAGALLYQIDPRDYQATLDQAMAATQRDSAQLDYARANASRGDELTRGGWLARDTNEQRASTLRQNQASLSMDEAAVRTAKLNLDYTEIRAPFAGRLGRNQAAVGTLVSVAGTVLNTLVQLDPIYVTFNPSETDLAALQKARVSGAVKADILSAGETQPGHTGTLTFLDNTIDRATGTLTARATITNHDDMLLPGGYVRVRLQVGTLSDALTIPQTAVGSSQLGKYVYVVGHDGRAEQHLITLGATDGDVVAVLSGLSPDNQVITGNLQKIGPGAPVMPLPGAGAS